MWEALNIIIIIHKLQHLRISSTVNPIKLPVTCQLVPAQTYLYSCMLKNCRSILTNSMAQPCEYIQQHHFTVILISVVLPVLYSVSTNTKFPGFGSTLICRLALASGSGPGTLSTCMVQVIPSSSPDCVRLLRGGVIHLIAVELITVQRVLQRRHNKA